MTAIVSVWLMEHKYHTDNKVTALTGLDRDTFVAFYDKYYRRVKPRLNMYPPCCLTFD